MMLQRTLAVCAVASFLVLVGCETKKQAAQQGGSNPTKTTTTGGTGGGAEDPAGETPAAGDAKELFGTCTITGTIQLEGTPPVADLTNQLKAKPECLDARGGEALAGEKVVANSNGTLRDVVVYVSKGIKGRYPAPSDPAVIDQKGCQYIPHVFTIQNNQNLLVKNSDAFLHNVSVPTINMNQSMPTIAEEKLSKPFNKKDGAVLFQCSVHPWMSAYAFVTKHPFVAKVADDGTYKIEKLPKGDYTISVWHETDRKLKAPADQKVSFAADGESKQLDFKYVYKN